MESMIVLVIFDGTLRALWHNPGVYYTTCYTACYVTFQERDRIMHHILSFALCMLIHSGARHRERKIGFYSFYRSNSSLRPSSDLLFLLVKARKRGHRTPPCLQQIISRRNATTFSIFRDPPHDGIKFACCHGMRIRSCHKRFYYVIEKKNSPRRV